MKLSWRTLLGVLHMFGGVVLFQLTLRQWGLKPAIAVSLAYLIVDGIWRLAQRQRLPAIWLLSNGMAVVFGIIDLWAKTPFMLRYEAPISNVIVGLVFVVSAGGERPRFIEFAEQGIGRPLPSGRSELIAFMRAFALAWAIYWFARAGVSLWLVSVYPLGKAFALRALIGAISLIAMAGVSLSGRRVFELCQRAGLFRSRAAVIEASVAERTP